MTDAKSKNSTAESPSLSLVHDQDEDFYLSSRYAGEADRARVTALFALQIELRRIPYVVSEPPLGEIRLQWFRDALDEIASGATVRAHPTIQAIAAAGLVDAKTRPDLDRLIDARAWLLYEPRFSSLDDLKSFLREAEAPIATIATGVGGALSPAIEQFADAYALARFAPLLAPDLAAEACAEAQRILHGVETPLIANADIIGRAAFLGLARGYAKRPDGRAWPIEKRLALFRCVMSGRF